MKLLSIVGARPQFVKLAPLVRAIAEYQRSDAVEHIIVHTGQHYDARLSDIFFKELSLPQPDYNLDVGSGPHGHQTGVMLQKIERVLLETAPDMALVFGDTNSTLAGALAASKLHIPIAHLEAGLRSHNRDMPEEINRIVADHVSDLLLAPTAKAIENLRQEGLAAKAVLTGDIMYEAVLLSLALVRQRSRVLTCLGLQAGDYGLVTLHRAENTDDPNRLSRILDTLKAIARDLPLIFPVHPRTAKRLEKSESGWTVQPRLRLIEPLSYFNMLQLLDNARFVLTDSGGLQKEAFFLGCPCVTLREETEWTETVQGGGNILAGADPEKILVSVKKWQEQYPYGKADFTESVRKFFGDENVSRVTLETLLRHSRNQLSLPEIALAG